MEQPASEVTKVSEAFCCAARHPLQDIVPSEALSPLPNDQQPSPCHDARGPCSSRPAPCQGDLLPACEESSSIIPETKASSPAPPANLDPRQRRRQFLQLPRRVAQQRARVAAVRYVKQAARQGVAKQQAARLLGVSPRTLRYWTKGHREDGLAVKPRGRRPLSCDVQSRNQVLRFLDQVTGPSIGLPALRALFGDVPRCVLEDLLRRYRRMWRKRYSKHGFRLRWHGPGRVWAVDFSDAPYLIDGVYRYLLAARDLASHQQLAWQPVNTEKAEEAVAMLRQLFAEHGPPLVLKSDNGSAFIARSTQQEMLEAVVAQLFSPARRPQYNGAVERSNGVLKTYTHQHAIHQGHPFRWTSQDLEHARTLANTISRPWGHEGQTPQEAWNARSPISDEERQTFQAALQKHRVTAAEDLGLDPSAELSVADRAALDRLALSRALQEMGYLTKTRVRRPPKKPKRKSRKELARRAAKLAEQTAAPDNPSPKAASPASQQTHPCHKQRRATARPVETSTDKVLAKPSRSATMPVVGNAISESTSHSQQHPTVTSTQREWAFYSWLRRSITLLLSLAKAAKIMR